MARRYHMPTPRVFPSGDELRRVGYNAMARYAERQAARATARKIREYVDRGWSVDAAIERVMPKSVYRLEEMFPGAVEDEREFMRRAWRTYGGRSPEIGVAALGPGWRGASRRHPPVRVYGAAGCPWCSRVRRWFRALGIEYTWRDVAQPAAARAARQLSGGDDVPVVLIGRQVIVGYDPAAMARALGRR